MPRYLNGDYSFMRPEIKFNVLEVLRQWSNNIYIYIGGNGGGNFIQGKHLSLQNDITMHFKIHNLHLHAPYNYYKSTCA